jgi:hypothetical protein
MSFLNSSGSNLTLRSEEKEFPEFSKPKQKKI